MTDLELSNAVRLRRAVFSGISVLAVIAHAGPALADVVDETGAHGALSEILVTARRTEENLKDVPVAVAALNPSDLAEQRIASEPDLQFATPGLFVRQTSSSNQLNYALRGQSIDSFSYTAPAVLTYFNEVQTGGTTATAFFDLQSIQVLKGPQGTLFGRNATGGAVLYSAQSPTDAFGGYVKAGYGNYDNIEAEGALNLPLASGIALRLAGRIQDRDGFQRNLYDNTRLNSVDSRVGRASLRIAPEGSRFENVAMFQYGKFGGRSGGLKMQVANGVNGAPATYVHPVTDAATPLNTNFRDFYGQGVVTLDPRIAQLGFTGIGDFLNKQKAAGFFDVYNDRPNTHRARQYLVTNTTSYELGDNLTVKNIFGYNDVYSVDATDVDGSPYQWLTVAGPGPKDGGFTYGTRQISNELQVSGASADAKLSYIVGAYFSREKSYNRIPMTITGDLSPPWGMGFIGAYDFTTRDTSRALFAQASYALNDRLNATAGLRYTWETVSLRQNAGSLLFTVDGKRKDSKPSWLAGLDFRVSDELMIYANQRGSWRAGGFNGTSPGEFPKADTFVPETTYDFELGAKFAGRIGGLPTRLNIAVYDQYIKNVQRAPYVGVTAVGGNVRKARVTGLELDGRIDLADWLQIGGALAWTDARYTNNVAQVGADTFYFGPYADAPDFSGSAFVRAERDLGAPGTLVLRGEVYGQSHLYYSNLDSTSQPGTRIGGYHLFNARAELNGIGGSPVSAAAYVRNLTNEKYEAGGIALSSMTGSNATLPGAPRMYGIEVGVTF
jgi:iron complex outermembrane receptor protein